MKFFLISDTHFGDDRILRYENRPFASVEEMDKAIIENWNSMVSKEDTVFHLGDVSSYEPERISEILAALNGKKVLIMGNHDQNYTNKQWEEMGLSRQSITRSCFVNFSSCPMRRCISVPICRMQTFMGISMQIPAIGMSAGRVPASVWRESAILLLKQTS